MMKYIVYLSSCAVVGGLIGAALAVAVHAQNMSQMGMAKRDAPKQYDLRDCMVYVPEIKDPELRKWCYVQSKRLP